MTSDLPVSKGQKGCSSPGIEEGRSTAEEGVRVSALDQAHLRPLKSHKGRDAEEVLLERAQGWVITVRVMSTQVFLRPCTEDTQGESRLKGKLGQDSLSCTSSAERGL